MSERKYVGGKERINPNNHYADLKKRLMEEKNFKEEDFHYFENNETSFNMNYHNIKADDIIYDLEARLFNDQEINTSSISKMIELIKLSLEEIISKKQKSDKNNKSNINNFNENKNKSNTPNVKSNILNSSTANKSTSQDDVIMKIANTQNNGENDFNIINNNILFKTENQNNNRIHFKIISTFDEDNNGFSLNRNDSEIKLNFFEEKITEEYPLVPINDNIFLEEYKNYFEKVKESFKENYCSITGQQSDTFDIDKFILLVLFENTEGKPGYKDIGFFDPLNNFRKYTLREEDFHLLNNDYYFFNGQIVMIEGEVDNYNTIALKNLRNGFAPDIYNLDYQYIMSFYRNVNFFYFIDKKFLGFSLLHICNEWSLLF